MNIYKVLPDLGKQRQMLEEMFQRVGELEAEGANGRAGAGQAGFPELPNNFGRMMKVPAPGSANNPACESQAIMRLSRLADYKTGFWQWGLKPVNALNMYSHANGQSIK